MGALLFFGLEFPQFAFNDNSSRQQRLAGSLSSVIAFGQGMFTVFELESSSIGMYQPFF